MPSLSFHCKNLALTTWISINTQHSPNVDIGGRKMFTRTITLTFRKLSVVTKPRVSSHVPFVRQIQASDPLWPHFCSPAQWEITTNVRRILWWNPTRIRPLIINGLLELEIFSKGTAYLFSFRIWTHWQRESSTDFEGRHNGIGSYKQVRMWVNIEKRASKNVRWT